jgi:hypothetical protein
MKSAKDPIRDGGNLLKGRRRGSNRQYPLGICRQLLEEELSDEKGLRFGRR